MVMTIDSKFEIGQIVYVKTDIDQNQRIVFQIKITQGDLIFDVACGTTTSSHYAFELTAEKTLILA